MGSDWSWRVQLGDSVRVDEAVCVFADLAIAGGLTPLNSSGTVTAFGSRGFAFHNSLPAAVSAGAHGVAFWQVEVDVWMYCGKGEDGRLSLSWHLDSCHCWREPLPEADGFRRLHRLLTSIWLSAAQQLDALHGRVTDEWSQEQISHLADLTDDEMPLGSWPSWVGWWTYFGRDQAQGLPPIPLPELAPRLDGLPSGGAVLSLLDDPAAVDEPEYQRIHERLLSATRG